jgi:hypothetical protein
MTAVLTDVTIHHVYGVEAGAEVGRSYTSGLSAVGHPEFAICTAGYREHAEQVLGVLVGFVVDHAFTFAAGDTIQGLIGGQDKPECRLLPVANPDQRLPVAYYRTLPHRVRALQIAYTVDGVWPWEPEYPADGRVFLLGSPVEAQRRYALTRDAVVDWVV